MSTPSTSQPRDPGTLRLVRPSPSAVTEDQRRPATGLSVAEYLTGWLASRRALRPSTALAYEIHLRRHLLPGLGQLPLTALTTEDIDAVYEQLNEVSGLSASTVRRVHATLMSALNAAVRRGVLDRNPARFVELPVTWARSPHTWTADEAAAFLQTVEGDRLAALWVVLTVCGVRRGEALGLRWADLDLASGTLRVEQQIVAVAAATHVGPPKSAHGRRTIALASLTVDALRAHRDRQGRERRAVGDAWRDTGLVFTDLWGRPVAPGPLTRRFEQLVAGTDLPTIRLHDLRHTSASLGLASGETLFEVSRRLGHSSIGITADVYGHLVPAMTRQSADRLAATLHPDPRPDPRRE